MHTSPARDVLVKRMLDLIQSSYAQVVTLRTLGATLERQPAHLGSMFRKELGITARECLTRVRLERATELIRSGVKIEAVSLIVGYRSKKNFYRQFKRYFATTPEEYRRRCRERSTPRPVSPEQPTPVLSAVNLRACDRALNLATGVQQTIVGHFATSPLAMLVTNDADRYVAANHTAVSITGYSVGELRELGPGDLFWTTAAEDTTRVWQIALPVSRWPQNGVLRRKGGESLGVHLVTLKNLLWGRPELSEVLDGRALAS